MGYGQTRNAIPSLFKALAGMRPFAGSVPLTRNPESASLEWERVVTMLRSIVILLHMYSAKMV